MKQSIKYEIIFKTIWIFLDIDSLLTTLMAGFKPSNLGSQVNSSTTLLLSLSWNKILLICLNFHLLNLMMKFVQVH